jgi:predicted enzyme related to lactoylglutathione lyase
MARRDTVSVLALAPPRRYSGQKAQPLNHLPETKLGRLSAAPRLFVDSNGEADMVDYHGRFVWYELMTTDTAAAKAFYAKVVGWGTQDTSAPGLAYTWFTVGNASASGLMKLPEEAKKMGVKPMWMGYVGVSDVDAAADRIKRLGGAVRVPPTDIPNISRFSIVADPQMAMLALVKWRNPGQQQPAELSKPGHVGWHELFAADGEKAFAVYGELFDWQKAAADAGPTGTYQQFSAGGQTIGGMFTKPATVPVPYWLYYFNIGDIDAAAQRVRAGGGHVLEGPLEVVDGSWIVRCTDPQGAMFALEGKRNPNAVGFFERVPTRGGRVA